MKVAVCVYGEFEILQKVDICIHKFFINLNCNYFYSYGENSMKDVFDNTDESYTHYIFIKNTLQPIGIFDVKLLNLVKSTTFLSSIFSKEFVVCSRLLAHMCCNYNMENYTFEDFEFKNYKIPINFRTKKNILIFYIGKNLNNLKENWQKLQNINYSYSLLLCCENLEGSEDFDSFQITEYFEDLASCIHNNNDFYFNNYEEIILIFDDILLKDNFDIDELILLKKSNNLDIASPSIENADNLYMRTNSENLNQYSVMKTFQLEMGFYIMNPEIWFKYKKLLIKNLSIRCNEVMFNFFDIKVGVIINQTVRKTQTDNCIFDSTTLNHFGFENLEDFKLRTRIQNVIFF